MTTETYTKAMNNVMYRNVLTVLRNVLNPCIYKWSNCYGLY